MLGVSGGASGTGFGGPTAMPTDATGMNNLQNSYSQLQQVASGQGPNPAMAQYTQNVQNLAKQQSGAISSIQGISPALASRMASQQGSGAMQNAAAAGANMQAQQQLGAMGQMGNIAAAQAQNATAMQQNVNNVNSGLAQTTMQGQQGMIGGIMNMANPQNVMGGSSGGGGGMGSMAGMAAMAAGGGEVRRMADGGSMDGPQSSFTQFLNSQVAPQAAPSVQASPYLPGVSGIGQGLGGTGGVNSKKGGSSSPSGAENQGQGPTVAASNGMGSGIPYSQPTYMSKGGKVPALVSPGETYIPPGKVNQAASSANPLTSGKKIPGTPKVAGNSYANDVVPAELEEGGVVIPNSIMQSKNPAAGAKDFIADIIAKRKGRK